MQKSSLHIQNCSQKLPQRLQKVLPWDSIFRLLKVLYLCVDLAYHPSCMSKKVKICPKTSLPWRSMGYGSNNMRPKFLGPFWWHLTPVQLDLKRRIKAPWTRCKYRVFWTFVPLSCMSNFQMPTALSKTKIGIIKWLYILWIWPENYFSAQKIQNFLPFIF